MSAWMLLVALVLLGANAFFVAVEFALVASRRTKLEALDEEGDGRARLALDATANLGLQLAGVQLGITMASLGLGAVAEPTIGAGFEAVLGFVPEGFRTTLSYAAALGLVVFLHMVLGEMVPKNAAIADPEAMLLRLSIPNRIYMFLFRPVIAVLNGIANAATRAFGVEPRDELTTVHTAQEIASILAESREEGLIEETAHELLSGAITFGERAVREVAISLDDVVTVDQGATVADAEALVHSSGHSRLLVTRPDGEITGFVHAKDLLTVADDARDRAIPLARIRRVLVVEADQPLDDVVVAMRRARTHLAIVSDGDDTLGIATLEDVLEDLVGDIVDESDPVARARRKAAR